ncbi:MAG: hypothetical protein NTW93_01560 [Phycisphaerae bacterium]|nr:hypothetical protein [Phycisphaerae bacterium]
MSTSYSIFQDKELFEYLGRALYECQRLEIALAHIICDFHLLKDSIQGNNLLERLQAFQKLLDSKLDCTLGMLVTELRKKLPNLDEKCKDLLSKALEKRNEVVHRFFYEHWVAVAMITPAGRNIMLKDLKQSIEIICAAYELSENIRNQLDTQMKSG